MGSRRKARECALQLLYQVDLGSPDLQDTPGCFWSLQEIDSPTREFAMVLFEGVQKNAAEIDDLLSTYSANWKVSRMASIDKNILRVAIFELMHCPDIPAKVTINEAVEIAKNYGTKESGAFVNGILDNIAKKVRQS
ncbi:MAG: transcription antitermination factor NusB [Pseudomonadota bacterium]